MQFLPEERSPRGHIVFLPPFAEEMNRCRTLVADQARLFAQSGYACTVLDFYGTGDSDGELEDASLERWYANIELVIATIKADADIPLSLWGLRLGGLIALGFAAQSSWAIENILLWQPVNGAKIYVNQILRQRVAAMKLRGLPPETTQEIREKLAQGERIEVAGYVMGGQLLTEVEALDLSVMENLCHGQIFWLEHVIEQGRAPGVAAQKAIDLLKEHNAELVVQTFTDPQVWQIANREAAPGLLASTTELLA